MVAEMYAQFADRTGDAREHRVDVEEVIVRRNGFERAGHAHAFEFLELRLRRQSSRIENRRSERNGCRQRSCRCY